ncbi:DUF1190 domain-containing protein [Salinicola avicenniae]|uniref:DUF1190 domain-containing protein n=1 Tax=Salinicola avicenniae TaxID=2916836 RepID=UPI0020749B68|nr:MULTISPECIES: DUF1190 domain-containing protein [unclassified Salinicola]
MSVKGPIRSRAKEPALDRSRRSKRVSRLALTLISSVPVVIYAWQPMTQHMRFLRLQPDCAGDYSLSGATCEGLIQEARQRNARVAPNYASLEDCQLDFPSVTWRQSDYSNRWATRFSHCEADDDDRYRPTPSGLMVSRSALSKVVAGEIAPEALAIDELQPIYAVDHNTLQGEQQHAYYSSPTPYFFSANGSYLGRRQPHDQAMNRQHLAETGRHYAKRSGGLPSRFSSHVTRGGFGKTAHASLARAVG